MKKIILLLIIAFGALSFWFSPFVFPTIICCWWYILELLRVREELFPDEKVNTIEEWHEKEN